MTPETTTPEPVPARPATPEEVAQAGLGAFQRKDRRARLAVRSNFYYEPPDRTGTALQPKYAHWIESEEGPYIRHWAVPDAWTPLDSGWLKDAALLVVENTDPTPAPGPYPSEEAFGRWVDGCIIIGILPEQESDTQRTMFSAPRCTEPIVFARVGPGQSCDFPPHALGRLFLRGMRPGSKTKLVTTLFPW